MYLNNNYLMMMINVKECMTVYLEEWRSGCPVFPSKRLMSEF